MAITIDGRIGGFAWSGDIRYNDIKNGSFQTNETGLIDYVNATILNESFNPSSNLFPSDSQFDLLIGDSYNAVLNPTTSRIKSSGALAKIIADNLSSGSVGIDTPLTVGLSEIIIDANLEKIGSVAYGDGVWMCGAGDHSGDGDIYRSTDDGLTWNKIEIGATIEQIRSVAYGDGVWMCGAGDHSGDGDIYRSTDDGLTWAKIEIGATIEAVNCIAYGASGTWLCGTGFGSGDGDIYRSTDNGLTWNKIEIGATVEQIFSVAYGDGVWMCGAGNNPGDGDVYRSTDDGLTWGSVHDLGAAVEQVPAMAYGNGRWICGGGKDAGDGDLYYSDDNGLNWAKIIIGREKTNSLAYANGIWMAGVGDSTSTGDILRSTDNGLTWVSVETGSDKENTHCVAYGDGIWIGGTGTSTGDAKIYRSIDNFNVTTCETVLDQLIFENWNNISGYAHTVARNLASVVITRCLYTESSTKHLSDYAGGIPVYWYKNARFENSSLALDGFDYVQNETMIGAGDIELKHDAFLQLINTYIDDDRRLILPDAWFTTPPTSNFTVKNCFIKCKIYKYNAGSPVLMYNSLEELEAVWTGATFTDNLPSDTDKYLSFVDYNNADYRIWEGSDMYGSGELTNEDIGAYDSAGVNWKSYFADKIYKLTKQLYPTGRSWWMKIGSVMDLLHDGLNQSESEVVAQAKLIESSLIPDNDYFDDDMAENWMRNLGLIVNGNLDQKKTAIYNKMAYPNGIVNRQNYRFLERQLRNEGFDVYVIENIFGSPPVAVDPRVAIYGGVVYGGVVYSGTGLPGYSICANYDDESKDDSFEIGSSVNLRSTFFICADPYPNFADVDFARKQEFRQLILKHKPAHTTGILLINYI